MGLWVVRASLASKKDRLECLERQLKTNRNHMEREARKAGKLEKKLRTLTSGYQSRSQTLVKEFADLHDQIEAARLELDTYQFLKTHEDGQQSTSFFIFTEFYLVLRHFFSPSSLSSSRPTIALKEPCNCYLVLLS